MIELEQWIYSQDIARWLSTRPALSLGEQMDCILSQESGGEAGWIKRVVKRDGRAKA